VKETLTVNKDTTHFNTIMSDDTIFDEVKTLAAELQRIPMWLNNDRRILSKRCEELHRLFKEKLQSVDF
jgi:hypothetical protein